MGDTNTKTALAKTEQPATNSPAAMMHAAIEKGVDLASLEKMMELQTKWDEQEAKKAYVAAMARFKADPPKINKDQHVSYVSKKTGTKTDYRHATLANVTTKINSALSKHGLSAAWTTTQASGLITVTCTITHEYGHSESTSLSASPDDSGGKNNIQAIGSTVSYLERYTILALTGLSTHEQDDDGSGASAPKEYVSSEQLTEIRKLLKKTGDKDKFLKWMGVEADGHILAKDYQKAINALNQKLAAKKKEGGKDA